MESRVQQRDGLRASGASSATDVPERTRSATDVPADVKVRDHKFHRAAFRERRHMHHAIRLSMRELSLYIHVPFCTRRCSYCSFYHVPSESERERSFVDALVSEILLAVVETAWAQGGAHDAALRPGVRHAP